MKHKVILLIFNKDLSFMAFQLKGPLRDKRSKFHILFFETDCAIEDIEELIQEQIEMRFGFRTNQLVRNCINDAGSIEGDEYLIYTCTYPCYPGPVTPANVADSDWFYMIELSKITDDMVDISELPNVAKYILQACKNPKMFKNEIIQTDVDDMKKG